MFYVLLHQCPEEDNKKGFQLQDFFFFFLILYMPSGTKTKKSKYCQELPYYYIYGVWKIPELITVNLTILIIIYTSK